MQSPLNASISMLNAANATAKRPAPLAACYQCSAPVPQGWSYCIACSESYAHAYYNHHMHNHAPATPPQNFAVNHKNGGDDVVPAPSAGGYYAQHVYNNMPSGNNNSIGNLYVQQEQQQYHHHHNQQQQHQYQQQYDRSPSGHSLTSSVVSVDEYNVELKCSGTFSASGLCGCCKKSVDVSHAMPNGTCSKRCEWVSCGCCPQCGRYSASSAQYIPGQPYCSIGCASQSHQANWCPTCGVRQMLVGSTHCSTQCAASSGNNFPIRQRKKIAQQNQYLRHEVMPDHERNGLLQPLRSVLSSMGVIPANVVKCMPHTVRRKNYLTYRAHVEQEMVAGGNTAKYGFGGEGNEQRRYLPLAIQCTLGAAGSPFSAAGTAIECCEDPSCTTCVVLRNGVTKEKLNVASHYCTSDFQFSLMHAMQMPSAGSLRAIAVCRAVVGTPSFVRDPAHIVPGKDQSHSTIILAPTTNSSGRDSPLNSHRQEGTYIFRDDAIEILHVVLVRQTS
eukprot:TRINITY_DN4441_c0_g1_i10.p1 TRINITY_DN4441_c0_g1~~TRINITY_DN4441_c0_g1_i10.p1  ORF type:complete len:502 (+),score=27.59 TRINITY_DN4441_c0_g1_i10:158-1663(+)